MKGIAQGAAVGENRQGGDGAQPQSQFTQKTSSLFIGLHRSGYLNVGTWNKHESTKSV
jgi:hypothetical protein